jgi:hypothetical protein
MVETTVTDEKMDLWEGRIGSGISRVVGFVLGGRAPADAAVVEAADLNPVAAVLPIRRAGAGLLVRPLRLVVGGLQRPGQPLYLRAPRVVRPRQSCDSHTNQKTEPFLISAKGKAEERTKMEPFRLREGSARRTDDEQHLGGAAAVPAVEQPDALRLVAALVPVYLAVRHCLLLAGDSPSSRRRPGIPYTWLLFAAQARLTGERACVVGPRKMSTEKNEGLRAEVQRKGRGIYTEVVVGTGAWKGGAGRDDGTHVDGWAGGYERRRGHVGASPSAESKMGRPRRQLVRF